jgi:hypothetical protein
MVKTAYSLTDFWHAGNVIATRCYKIYNNDNSLVACHEFGCDSVALKEYVVIHMYKSCPFTF